MVNNKVILIGRVTRDVQLVEAKKEGQKKIVHFNLAVDKMRKKSGADGVNSEESTAYFFRCTAFDMQVLWKCMVRKGLSLLWKVILQQVDMTRTEYIFLQWILL